MTHDETVRIFRMLAAAFPGIFKATAPDSLSQQIDLWTVVLHQDDFEMVKLAVCSLIRTEQTVPTIAQVLKQMQNSGAEKGGKDWFEYSAQKTNLSYRSFPVLKDGSIELIPGCLYGNSLLVDSLPDLERCRCLYFSGRMSAEALDQKIQEEADKAGDKSE